LEASTEQEAHNAAVNGILIEPITQAPSVPEITATDVIIIDNDSGTDNVILSQEWDSNIKSEPVDSDVDNTTMEADANHAAKPLGTISDTSGQRRSARLARNTVDGRVHLTYRGQPYILSPKGSVVYDTGDTYVEGQAHFSVSSLQQAFQEGVTHINVTEGDSIEMTQDEINAHVVGVAMLQQFSLKAGLKHFGKGGEEAVTSELTQMHDMHTYVPIDPESMTPQQKSETLNSLIFLTEKRNGDVKSRMCGDGSKQRHRPGYKKEDSASPTVSLEGVLLTAAIEAHELRHIACFDIPGAFLHAKCEDGNVFMLLKGKLAELMTLVEPKLYRQHVRYDNAKGEAMLYVKMSKALYGMLKSALWFYKKLKVDLEAYGFVINPYDPCVANATINGK